jgi:hypothetical protein
MRSKKRNISLIIFSLVISLQCLAQRDSTSHQIKIGLFGVHYYGYGLNHCLLFHKDNKFVYASYGLGSSSSFYSSYIFDESFAINQELGIGLKRKKSDYILGLSYKLDFNSNGLSDRAQFFEDRLNLLHPYTPKVEPFYSLFFNYQFNFKRIFIGSNMSITYSFAYNNENMKLFPVAGIFAGYKFSKKSNTH